MDLLIVSLVAFAASGLTLFSGFGLGSLLLPAFLLFFPAELAVAMTAIVHFLNNVFKLFLLGKHADRSVVIRFGIPALAASFLGAALLMRAADLPAIWTYELFGSPHQVLPVNLLMGILIVVFALLESVPVLDRAGFSGKHLVIGGMLSGFFGGLSGHQGALRSAFLIRAGLSKEAFIATGVVVACLVDITRLGVYAQRFSGTGLGEHVGLLLAAVGSAFLGSFIGSRLMTKVTMRTVQVIVSLLLVIVGTGLVFGIL
jgi:uncharacterized membrane protein YfcA